MTLIWLDQYSMSETQSASCGSVLSVPFALVCLISLDSLSPPGGLG